jgi:hypothetical protein
MDYHETLQALKDRGDAGQVVEVHVRAAGAEASPPPVLLQGTLSTKWHPEMTDPPPAAVFFVGESRWSSFILTEADFQEGSAREDGGLRIAAGGLLLDVSEAVLLEAIED